jgi:hypothetical protein
MNKITMNLNINNFKSKKINLGSGTTYFEDYLNIDLPNAQSIYPRTKSPDLQVDFTTIGFNENSLEELVFSHCLEHFKRFEYISLLIRFNKWLQLNGKLNIFVPDINQCMNEFITADYKRKKEIIRHMFGSHEDQYWSCHQEGFFNEMVEEILTACGFSNTTFKNVSGQWPYINVISYKTSKPNLELIKKYLQDFSPNDEILLNYWLEEIKKEL